VLPSSENRTEDTRRKAKDKHFEATTDNGKVSVMGAGARLKNGMHLDFPV